MSRTTILVTETEYAKGREVFEAACSEDLTFAPAPGDEAGLSAKVEDTGAAGVTVGVSRYVGPLYDSLPSGGLIARFGVGHDGIDKARAKEKGLYVTNTPGVLDTSVSEHAIFLMGALARNIPALSENVASGTWNPCRGIELRGKTLSLIGFGCIAREVAGIAARGFRMNIVVCDIVRSEEQADFISKLTEDSGVEIHFTGSVDDALGRGDFISVHLPLTDNTRGLIDAVRLGLMARGSYLVNTSRGGIVNEVALYDALSFGHLAGAAFDVFEKEPYVPVASDKDLRTLANVIMTPHISSSTDMSNRRMAETCVAIVLAFIEGHFDKMNFV